MGAKKGSCIFVYKTKVYIQQVLRHLVALMIECAHSSCNASRGVLSANLNSDVGFKPGGKSGLLFRDVGDPGEVEISPRWITSWKTCSVAPVSGWRLTSSNPGCVG